MLHDALASKRILEKEQQKLKTPTKNDTPPKS